MRYPSPKLRPRKELCSRRRAERSLVRFDRVPRKPSSPPRPQSSAPAPPESRTDGDVPPPRDSPRECPRRVGPAPPETPHRRRYTTDPLASPRVADRRRRPPATIIVNGPGRPVVLPRQSAERAEQRGGGGIVPRVGSDGGGKSRARGFRGRGRGWRGCPLQSALRRRRRVG
jgi:hypothetical protein